MLHRTPVPLRYSRAIDCVIDHQPIDAATLAYWEGYTDSSAGRRLRQLEADGHVERVPGSRRPTRFVLSTRGRCVDMGDSSHRRCKRFGSGRTAWRWEKSGLPCDADPDWPAASAEEVCDG